MQYRKCCVARPKMLRRKTEDAALQDRREPGVRRSLPMTLLTHAVLLTATAVTLYPVVWVVKMALTPSQGFSSAGAWPAHPTLDNFRDVVSTRDLAGRWLFGRQLANSLIVAAAVTAVGLALSTSAAYALSRFRFPGRAASLRAF